jgi:gluconokinase
MGVSGSGKTTVGELLARRLGVEYADADDFHSDECRGKLASGVPLTDSDREPWLRSIANWLREHDSGVVTCSALKRRYRDVLRQAAPDCVFLYCAGSLQLISERMAHRQHHFMPASLLQSQFDELEPPDADENAVTADIAHPPDVIVDHFIAAVSAGGAH